MNEPERTFLMSGATLDGESVGPMFLPSAEAHDIGRKAGRENRRTVRILRDSDAGWVEVARYTDSGRHPAPLGMRVGWGAIVVADKL